MCTFFVFRVVLGADHGAEKCKKPTKEECASALYPLSVFTIFLGPPSVPGRQKKHKKAHVRRSSDRYLVDPASSHMLVSKIKPCMSKYKQLIL